MMTQQQVSDHCFLVCARTRQMPIVTHIVIFERVSADRGVNNNIVDIFIRGTIENFVRLQKFPNALRSVVKFYPPNSSAVCAYDNRSRYTIFAKVVYFFWSPLAALTLFTEASATCCSRRWRVKHFFERRAFLVFSRHWFTWNAYDV